MKKLIIILTFITLIFVVTSCVDNSNYQQQIDELTAKLESKNNEINELKEKLKAFENANEQSESNANLIKEKEQQIEELKEKVKNLEKENKKNQETPTQSNNYKHNQPLDTPGMVNVDGFIEANTINNPTILNEVTKESLINKYNWLPDGYVPDDLVEITSNTGYEEYLRKEAAEAYENMINDAEKEGLTFVVFSAYRSYDLQNELYTSAYNANPDDAIRSIAYPGSSEHSSGLAIDISYNEDFPDDFYSTEHGIFLKNNAHKYGFILRYPEGKEEITNYKYESWHYRYVGVDIATEIKNKGITLEEYYGTDTFE